jgi:alpha-tubulin suppressor-like RCC1 family protein
MKSEGQLGDGTTTNRLLPTLVNTAYYLGKKVNQISVGYYHSCLITNDSNSYCFGRNEYKTNNKTKIH